MASKKFKNVYISDYYTIVGPKEKESKLKKFDMSLDDYYFGEKTFEQAEIKMQKTAILNMLKKNNLNTNNINLLVGGDLTNQIAVTNASASYYGIPFLGLYAACATFTESLIVASEFIESGGAKKAISIVSSHNLTAERQFRYPIEYGAPKPHTATFTTTGAVATLLSKVPSKIKVESATIGTPVDLGIKDAFHMGAVMAPAAAKVINDHLQELKRTIDYYDLVLTGDLGCIGGKILQEYMQKTYDITLNKYLDAGCVLYLDSQDTYAGASGPACMPIVLFNKILTSKKYKKILVVATGALHSPTLVNQKKSIPAIAHAISLEVE